jgi:hypothetical protein
MNDTLTVNDTVKLAAAVAAGYLLGRTKQGKRALRLALWVTGAGGGSIAVALAKQAVIKLGENETTAPLIEQIRGPLTDAARAAVISSLEGRANAFSDALHDRTLTLTEGLAPADEDEERAEQPEAASADDAPAEKSGNCRSI